MIPFYKYGGSERSRLKLVFARIAEPHPILCKYTNKCAIWFFLCSVLHYYV